MNYSKLGSSGLDVSRVCLGSMTWGYQNTQADADQQIAYALEVGVNFIDTAEMYAVPPSADTYGKTEAIIGDWLRRNSARRDEIVLASKIAGPGLDWVRDGAPVTGATVLEAVEGSLRRLQTDYIDLYQIHWPNRPAPHFNRHWPNMVGLEGVEGEQQLEMMHEILEGLQRVVAEGKVRHCGLSNETPWGISAWQQLAREHGLPAMVSVQNEFSLVHAKDSPYLLESCQLEDVAYLPWSPIGGGLLSGKYSHGETPAGSRWSINQRNGIFRDTERVHEAVRAYEAVAQKHGITTAQLALGWVDQVQGVTSTIIGATTMEQLKEDLVAFEKPLSAEAMADIDAVFRAFPVPF